MIDNFVIDTINIYIVLETYHFVILAAICSVSKSEMFGF